MTQVTLKIVGTQKTFDGEENTIELITQGKYYEKSDSTFLVYDESEISGMEGSTTTLKIEDEKIMMKRFGSNESKLIFEKGEKHKTSYATVYGEMEMEVITSQINIKKNEEGLKKIDLSYKLNISQNIAMENTLSIDILSLGDL